MKQPVNWGQIIATSVVILIACFTGIVASNREVSELKNEVANIKVTMYDIKIENTKQVAKLENKIDEIQRDITQILVNQEKKVDRK